MNPALDPASFPADLRPLAAKVLAGERLDAVDAALCFTTPHVLHLGRLANHVRRKLHGDLDSIVARRYIRIAVPWSRMWFYLDGVKPSGISADVGTRFAAWLSDRIGRKPIILVGCALAALTYFPAFQLLTSAANPAMAKAQATAAVTVTADPGSCAFQFDPVGRNKIESTGCDIA